MPDIQLEQHFNEELDLVRAEAVKTKNQPILNWLRNKEGKNAWVIKCVSPATSKMKREDWYSTSHNTNIAESAHVVSQKDGTRLTLLSAIQVGKTLDMRSFDGQNIAQNMGVFSRHGNLSLTGNEYQATNEGCREKV